MIIEHQYKKTIATNYSIIEIGISHKYYLICIDDITFGIFKNETTALIVYNEIKNNIINNNKYYKIPKENN